MTHFYLYQQALDWPTDWSKWFGRNAPLIVEIGFGGGHFLVDLAQKRPTSNILGVEISIPSMQRAERKIRHRRLKNVCILQADARFFLQLLCKPESIRAVHLNFPDPWPKASHHHRRLINLDFLHLLATRIEPRGQLHIATDHPDYQTAVTEALSKTPYFHTMLDTPFVVEDSERLQTKYEKTALAQGRTCHYYKWQRNDRKAPNCFQPLQEFPMPHVVIKTALSLPDIRQRYQPFTVSEGDVHVKFGELFGSNDGQKLFIETFVTERPLSQRLGILIRQRDNDEIIILLHEVGFPRSTAGLHFAISQIAQWLLQLKESGVVLKSNLQVPLMKN